MVTISSYLDESGKFSDSGVVALGGVVTLTRAEDFCNHWRALLMQAGLKFLEMKEALKAYRPLSATDEALGPLKRGIALLPFVKCIRKHLEMIIGIAIDVPEFKKTPEQYRKIWSDDPCYTAFARIVLEIAEDSPQGGLHHIICDDEENTAFHFYKLYRKIKNQYSDARGMLGGITFADDRFSFPLQAADLVASLLRQEALFKFHNKPYQYRSLFDALSSDPIPGEKVLKCGFAWCGVEQLSRLGKQYKDAKKDHKIVKLKDLSE